MNTYMIFNTSLHNVFIDIDGKKETDDIIVIGPKGKEKVSLSDERAKELQKEFRGKVIIKRV